MKNRPDSTCPMLILVRRLGWGSVEAALDSSAWFNTGQIHLYFCFMFLSLFYPAGTWALKIVRVCTGRCFICPLQEDQT